jgi:hypothetical protein
VQPIVRLYSCLIDKTQVPITVEVDGQALPIPAPLPTGAAVAAISELALPVLVAGDAVAAGPHMEDVAATGRWAARRIVGA